MRNKDIIFQDSTIMIVDDIPENLQVLGSIFAAKNANLIIAQDGETAISNAKEEIPDIILLDIAMPGTNGFDVCRALKEDPTTRNIPIIFVTAKTSAEDLQKGFEMGAVDYVTKPFNTSELLMRVSNHLELSKSQKSLEKLLDDKNKFISLVAHDIKSPLSGVKALMGILVDEYDAMDDSEKKEIVESLYDSIVNQYSFVDDLLKWGQLQLNRVELHKVLVTPELIISSIISVLKLNASNKSVSLVSEIKTDKKIFADATHVENVISNLVSNAIKFSPKESSIVIAAESSDQMVVISVKDNGVGMSNTDKDKLFKKSIIHTTLGTNNEKGTGLGLLLTKEMVEKNGGQIWFESELGKGTTFFVSFPAE
ncbi:MAG: hybrid sensor histidine kinase/response regulator [Candidatus Kapaibacterium sp.]